jgi:hypothetical protein
MPLTGRPTLSSIEASCCFGITPRMVASTSSVRRAVSSMRVPVGARMCSRISPVSTDGKKSRPANGSSASEPTHAIRKVAMKVRGVAIAFDSTWR